MTRTASDYFDAANAAELHGQYEEANANYETAMVLQPDFPEAYDNRANNWVELGEYRKAIADYEKVIAYWPHYAGAHDSLAQIYLFAEDDAFHNIVSALGHAKRACELSQFVERGPLSTLAAAYAANGEYADAVRMQKSAIRLASRELESELWVPGLKEQLATYERKLAEQRHGKGWWARLLGRSFKNR